MNQKIYENYEKMKQKADNHFSNDVDVQSKEGENN